MTVAREIAQSRGFRYLQVQRVKDLPIEQLLERIEGIPMRNDKPDLPVAQAILGTVKPPQVKLSRAWEIFWDMTEDHRAGMTDDQVRIWRNPRRRSINDMIDLLGDIPITEISGDELLDYRDAMWARVRAGEIKAGTANKQMGHAFHVLKTVSRARRLGVNLAVDGMMFRDLERNTRLPFSDDWIRERLLAPGALDDMNIEARCLLLGMINSGYRPLEAAGLRPEDIRLNAEIPHISINSRHRTLKTKESEREIPLVGVSLEDFRQCPGGFPRYLDKSSVTATINKFMREHGLRETPEHTLYGLRHSFEDRLFQAGVDERIRRDLMGHRLANRERYGAGARLSQLHVILTAVAIG
jgi:integrase